jgi:FtsZ-binding cell division protein ZapB
MHNMMLDQFDKHKELIEQIELKHRQIKQKNVLLERENQELKKKIVTLEQETGNSEKELVLKLQKENHFLKNKNHEVKTRLRGLIDQLEERLGKNVGVDS